MSLVHAHTKLAATMQWLLGHCYAVAKVFALFLAKVFWVVTRMVVTLLSLKSHSPRLCD